MKCPLFYIGKTTVYHGEVSDTNNCLKEECAWWNKEHDTCDPTGTIPWLGVLIDCLIDIRKESS